MNRIIFPLVICFVALTNPILAADPITISDFVVVQGVEGQEFTIELNNDQPYAAFQFDLYLPEGITINEDGFNATDRMEGINLQMQQQTDGSYRFIAIPQKLTTNITGTSGAIITITVTASSDVALKPLTGYFRNIKLSKANGEGPTYSEMSFPITVVKNTIKGDANGDKEVNITDITYIIDKINNKVPADFDENAADLNGDGEINITDVTLVLDIINAK